MDWASNSTASDGPLAIAFEQPPVHLPAGERYRRSFAVGGICVKVSGETPESVDLGALFPFSVAAHHHDIDVSIAWQSGVEACAGKEIFHSGCLWRVHEFGNELVFDFVTEHLGKQPYKRLTVDRDFRRACIVLNQQLMAPQDSRRALEYPLDELLITHHLSLAGGVELHACGMVNAEGESFLFAGHSGAGKSTTARLWTEHSPVQVLSDDRIIVRRGGQACPERSRREYPPHAYLMHGTPWHGEAAFALPGSAPLRRIFLLEHGPENRMERISRSAAVGELLARSFTPLYSSRFVEPVLSFLEELVQSVPCYRFHFVPDRSAVEKILEFRD